ncbi:unnamed protein product [Linum trigynum]|uniref:Uncharacterized protein n=1 Tax=Linum trigynum TaxID=586398 RepID=A0AAV2DK23_9ROSI
MSKTTMDLGSQGILFSMIDSPKMAKVVSSNRFSLAGIRESVQTAIQSEEGVKKANEIGALTTETRKVLDNHSFVF